MTNTSTPRRVALITGGTGGIGAAASLLFAADGYDIAFTYRSNETRRNEIEDEMTKGGTKVLAKPVDLSVSSDVLDFVGEVTASFGTVNAVVHAGGPYVPQHYVSQLTPEKYSFHVDSELKSFFNLVHATLPHLRAARGSIVAVTTVAVRRFPVRDSLSSTPKAGIEALVRSIAVEEGRFGVRANCVGPGIMEDGMGAALQEKGDFPERDRVEALKKIPMRRFGLAREVAELVSFLASERASYISGQMIDVDGGYSC